MNRQRTKKPWLGVFLSSVFPGFGHIYSGKKIRGCIFIFFSILFSIIFLKNFLAIIALNTPINITEYILAGTSFIILGLIYFLSLFESYKYAKLYNLQNKLEIDLSRKKSPWFAVFLSEFIPGVGQIYNKQIFKSIGFIFIFMILDLIFNIWTRYFLNVLFAILVVWDAFYYSEKINNKIPRITNYINPQYFIMILVVFFINDIPVSVVSQKFKEIEAYKIASLAMEPTLMEGDRALVDKRYYKENNPKRGDMILVEKSQNKKVCFYIRRIVGLPKERIKKLNIVIPPNQFYVLPDNLNYKSTFYGLISKTEIKGKAYKIFYPLNRLKKIK